MGESCFYLISLVYGLGVLSHHIVSIGIYCVHQFCGLWLGVIIMHVLFSSQDISLLVRVVGRL